MSMKGKGRSARLAATAQPRSSGGSGSGATVVANGVDAVADRRADPEDGLNQNPGANPPEAPEQAQAGEPAGGHPKGGSASQAASQTAPSGQSSGYRWPHPLSGAPQSPPSGAGPGAGPGAQAAAPAAASGTQGVRSWAAPPLVASRTESGGAVYYDERETWKNEFQARRGQTVELRDGLQVEVGQRYSAAGYYVTEGKTREHATGAYYMSAGLDGVETVEEDPHRPGRYYITDRDGTISAYDGSERRAADLSGENEKTPAQTGALMAGTRRQLEGDPSSYAAQYRNAYDAYMADRSKENNVRATDAFYAWSKAEGRSENTGFADTGLTRDLEGYRQSKEAAAAAAEASEEAQQERGLAANPDSNLNADHGRLLSFSAVREEDDAPPSAGDSQMVPKADPSFVLSPSHEEVARDMGVARSMGMKSFSVSGEPGTGKNFLLEQLSAAEERPHLEIDVDESTEVSELFGASTMQDGKITWQEGKVTSALKSGHRVVLNEANTAPVEVMTQFHNIVGSGNSTESRFITFKSPEAGETRIPVHPESEIVFTYNPEGTGREGGLGRALADRVEHFNMRRPSRDEGAKVVASQANKFLEKAGKNPLSGEEATKCLGFFDDLRSSYRDNQPGIVKEPDTRWLHRFAAFRAAAGREMSLRRCEEFLDRTSAGSSEGEQMRQSISHMYNRWFGSS